MQHFKLLDEIHLKDRTLTGVVDYVTTKNIIFYDISMNDNPEVIKMLLLWRMFYTHIRFSVFKELYFHKTIMSSPNLINRKKIVSPSFTSINKPNRSVKHLTKKLIVAASDRESQQS